ncbi:MAG: hypothetical protein ACON35_01490 [Candidatus Marinamargulisbacteria bacterium]
MTELSQTGFSQRQKDIVLKEFSKMNRGDYVLTLPVRAALTQPYSQEYSAFYVLPDHLLKDMAAQFPQFMKFYFSVCHLFNQVGKMGNKSNILIQWPTAMEKVDLFSNQEKIFLRRTGNKDKIIYVLYPNRMILTKNGRPSADYGGFIQPFRELEKAYSKKEVLLYGK